MLRKKQLTAMTVNAIVVRIIITFPRYVFEICGNSAYMAMIYVSAIALLCFGVTNPLYRTKINVIGMSERLGGKPLRIITGMCVFILLSLNFISVLRIFPEVIRLVLLQKTYTQIIAAVFAVCVVLGASLGLEAAARIHQLFLPIAAAVFAAFIIMLVPDLHFGYILPIFGNGLESIFVKALPTMSVFTDLLMLNILIPEMQESESYKKVGVKAIFYGGGCATLIFLVYGLCYSYPSSSQFIIPIYQLERLINLSDFFSRLEAVFQFVWSLSLLLYSVLYAAVLARVWGETFCLHHTKPIITPVIISLIGISLIPKSLNDMMLFEISVNRWIYIPSLLIPLVIGLLNKAKMFHVKHFEKTA